MTYKEALDFYKNALEIGIYDKSDLIKIYEDYKLYEDKWKQSKDAQSFINGQKALETILGFGKYTRETLTEINMRFCHSHSLGIKDSDLLMANNYVRIIEYSRSKKIPKVGDIVEYTNEYGDYYMNAHIENVYEDGNVHICGNPYVPFISISKSENGISCSTSGGAWCTIPATKLIYIGEREKTFCDWGHYGPCADGAVEFKAKVSVWRYTSNENKFISKNTRQPYTTKDFSRMKIYYCADKYGNPKNGSNYIYFGDAHAWKSDLDLQAWLRTFRAEVFDWGDNGMFVWYWREERHSVSPKEFEALDLAEDTLMNNARVLRCKRKYDEENHIVHTYWVWYWDDPTKGWREAAMEQNKIREKFYELDWHMPVNQYAINEIKSGRVKPINLDFLKK